MTERGVDALTRSADRLRIGPSTLEWHGDVLRLQIDEVAAPWPRRVRGRIDVHVDTAAMHPVSLDPAGRHRWGVIAPQARIEVALAHPALRWSGSAYLDCNRGSAPLEHDFTRWNWSRAHLPEGRTAVLYDVERRHAGPLAIATCFDAAGAATSFDPPPLVDLPVTGWRLHAATRSDAGSTPRVVQSMEDGPFYARSMIETRWMGQPVTSVHEHLSLERFGQRWVRALLPFRMPRRMF